MKLRIRGYSVLLRLSRNEVAEPVKTSRVEEVIRFGPDLQGRLIDRLPAGGV